MIMALFEDESVDDMEEDINVYLSDPEKGIELINAILSRDMEKNNCTEFDDLLSDEILPILAELNLENEFKIYKSLIKIRDKVKEQQKIKLLAGKKVLGVGGQFSSGKSCFINSITNAKLPEDQRATTSIATYIVNAKEKKNIAISNSNNVVELGDEAVEALAHQFYRKYQIGFSKMVKNLVVYTPGFTYPNVAILDTPGYNKADNSKNADSSDAEMAREQLKSVDYLIWLVDSNRGVITQQDLDFISTLNVDSEILVIFTKAASETKKNLSEIIDTTKKVLRNISMEVYDVIAYDSQIKEVVIGEGVLKRFLDEVNNADVNNVDSEDVVKQVCKISDDMQKQIKEQDAAIRTQKIKLDSILRKSLNIEHMSSVVKEYGKCGCEQKLLEESKKKLEKSLNKLICITKGMVR